MEVLIVRVAGGDAYYKLGISSLIINQWKGKNKKVRIVPDDAKTYHLSFDFDEEVVVIHSTYFTGASHASQLTKLPWGNIYVPFNCRRSTLAQIEGKISRILAIPDWKIPNDFDLINIIAHNDLKRYQQLSPSEFMIITFIGQGIDCNLISKKMDRSIKTVRTHYRSACRKLGFDNQADFFRFAKYISKNSQGVINALCL
ncbi:helix-turn-helix transcriptional regulator [Rosenbergiella nectarea]|uniref:helix-turn-helix transcriptional regulator n=1 Tax=Rosenbergiella nectarea TaxID=988801 RepID=UPI001BD95BA4|nr:LuxR C-terminal-related transcriptional regulator [Rosenbergiella nectarea]MBT0729776.1 hypothetical protein [Rosenbergiella nectarea subsp. apis]